MYQCEKRVALSIDSSVFEENVRDLKYSMSFKSTVYSGFVKPAFLTKVTTFLVPGGNTCRLFLYTFITSIPPRPYRMIKHTLVAHFRTFLGSLYENQSIYGFKIVHIKQDLKSFTDKITCFAF